MPIVQHKLQQVGTMQVGAVGWAGRGPTARFCDVCVPVFAPEGGLLAVWLSSPHLHHIADAAEATWVPWGISPVVLR